MNSRVRIPILVLTTTVLASAVIAFAAQRPSHGDGGVSAFYAWNEEIRDAPGALLRQEPVPEHLELTSAAKGIRVLYTSTNGIDGKTVIAVSGAIYFPKGAVPAGGWPIAGNCATLQPPPVSK